ncbi:MAG: hypothetical protein GYA51_02990 [Candidatus Methanofastidiosa archaeon]|nr:hypothetical protein [Candidatus Methanofastidiosa archaeon]
MDINTELAKFRESQRYKRNRGIIERLIEDLPEQSRVPLKTFLDKTDIYWAPASTKYHGNYFGGLAEHIIEVYNILIDHGIEKEMATKVAIIHDFCKLNFYTPCIKQGDWREMTPEEYSKYKRENPGGRAQKIRPEEIGFKIENDPMLGHGEYSIILAVQAGIPLTLKEMQIIRWHMGHNEYTNYSFYQNNLLNANRELIIFQFADMISAHEKRENEEDE